MTDSMELLFEKEKLSTPRDIDDEMTDSIQGRIKMVYLKSSFHLI